MGGRGPGPRGGSEAEEEEEEEVISLLATVKEELEEEMRERQLKVVSQARWMEAHQRKQKQEEAKRAAEQREIAEQRALAESFVKALRALLEELKVESHGGDQAAKGQRLDSSNRGVTLTTSEGERQYDAAREGAVVGMEGCHAGA